MEHGLALIPTLAICLGAALALGLAARRVGLSPIAGYLIAGVLVGPHTPGLVANSTTAAELSELGVLLLMFGVGLQLHVRDLLAVRKVAPPGAALAMVITGAIGYAAGRGLGWTFGASLVVGCAISVASTVVVVRVLTEQRALHTPSGHLAMGWLVAEDLASVLVLVLLPIAAADARAHILKNLAVALGGVALMIGLAATAGRALIPAFLARIARTRSTELFTLGVLVTALGIAVIAARLFGASLALGAFLAGMIVGQSDLGSRAASDALPMRDAFAVLFFVAVGMTFDPEAFVADPGPALLITAIVLFGKPIIATAALRVLGQPLHKAVRIAAPLAQIGELSFVIAAAGATTGLLTDDARRSLIAASIFSILLNPILVRAAKRLFPPTDPGGPMPSLTDQHRAVVVGYGPVGRVLVRLLQENGIEPTVIDLNPDAVAALRSIGVRAICGDASRREILESAGAAQAVTLIYTASGTPLRGVAGHARELQPSIRVLVRAAYLHETPAARDAGADRVVSAEAEVALAMAEVVLDELGATADQLHKTRARLRRELAVYEDIQI